MAVQNADNKMSKLTSEKNQIQSYFDDLNKKLPIIEQKLLDAQNAGDTNLANEISSDLSAIKSEANSLGDRYAEIEFSLGPQKELEQISESTGRLREGRTKEEFATSKFSIGAGGSLPSWTPTLYNKKLVDEQKKKDLSVISGVDPNMIDPNAYNAPPSERLTFGALVSDDSRAEFLQNKYGAESVLPVTLDGKTEFLVKKKDGTAFTTENKGVVGTLGAVATEVPIVAGEIGAFTGTLGATKSPALAYAAAAGTRTALGSVIDTSVEKLAGVEPQWNKAFTNRGTEALVGLVMGPLADKGTSMFLGQRIAPNFANEFADSLEGSASRLMQKEISLAKAQGRAVDGISVPVGARIGGEAGLESQQILAGSGYGGLATPMKQTQETIRNLWDSFVNDIPLNPSVYKNAAKQKLDNFDKLSQEISKRSNVSVSTVRNSIEGRQQALSKFTADEDKLGEILGNALRESEESAAKIKNEAFNEIFDLADSVGANYDPKDLYSFAVDARMKAQKGGAFDNTAVRSVESRLERRANAEELLAKAEEKKDKLLSKDKDVPASLDKEIKELNALIGPMDAREFDYWIRAFNDARPDNLVGAATKDQLGSEVSKQMSSLRRNFYSSQEVTLPDGSVSNLGDLYGNATARLQERMKFEGNLLGRILKEQVGENKMFPREIASAVMAEPAKINNVLGAISMYEAQDPARAGLSNQIRDMMKSQYLHNLGFGKPGVNVNSIKYDRGMVDAIWGRSAPRMIKSMDELNGIMSKAKLGKHLSIDDVKLLEGSLDDASRKKAMKQIYMRMSAERDLERAQNSVIYKMAQKGDFKSIDPDMLSKFIMSDGTTPTQAKNVLLELGKSSLAERNAFKGDFIRELVNSFPGGKSPYGEPFTPMFDTESFVRAMDAPIGGKSALRSKVESVLGKDGANFIYDIAKVNNANMIKFANEGEPLRATGGPSGISFYLAHGVTKSVRNRITAALLTNASKNTPLRNKMIRAMGQDMGLSGKADIARREMLKDIFATRSGITELASQAKDDEEFSLYLSDMAKKFKKDDALLKEMLPEE